MANVKRILVRTSAGIAGAALLVFGITQCNGKRDERAAKESALRSANETQEQYIKAVHRLQDAAVAIDSLLKDNGVQADSIIVLNDSIQVLNDSLDLTQRQLIDCRNSKKKTVRKSQPGQKQPKPQPRVVDTVMAPSGVNNETIIELRDSVKNDGDIVVANGDTRGNNKTQITLGNGAENNGTIVVNNGGNVTIYGKNATENTADTLKNKAHADTLRAKVICVWTKRERSWTR